MKHLLLLISFVFVSICAKAQYQLGVINNNYGGLNTTYFNPAMGHKTRVSINLVGANFNLYNNFLKVNSFNIVNAVNDSSYFSGPKGWSIDNNVVERVNGKSKYMTSTIDLRGPGILIGIGKFQVGVIWNRIRFGFQLSNVDETLARNLFYIGRSSVVDVSNIRFSTNKFTINMNAWAERGITGAFALKDNNETMLRLGMTVKSLNGLGAMYLKNEGTTFSFYKNANSTNTDSVLYADYDLELGFTNEYSYANNPTDQLDTFTSNHREFDKNLFINNILKNQKRLGHGTSFDVGFVYEKRNGDKSKYRFRLAASLVDFGSIKYDNLKTTYTTKYKGTTDVTIPDGIVGYNSRQYDTAIARYFKSEPGRFQSFTMALPTSLNVGFDYRFTKNIFINGTWIQSVRSKYTQGIRAFSSISAAIRYESKFIGACIPVVWNDGYQNFNIGFCLSLLNSFYIGSDNIGGAFGIGSIAGTDIYSGLSINIAKHTKKKKNDSDIKPNNPATPENKKEKKAN